MCAQKSMQRVVMKIVCKNCIKFLVAIGNITSDTISKFRRKKNCSSLQNLFTVENKKRTDWKLTIYGKDFRCHIDRHPNERMAWKSQYYLHRRMDRPWIDSPCQIVEFWPFFHPFGALLLLPFDSNSILQQSIYNRHANHELYKEI